MSTLEVIPVPCLQDNYAYLLRDRESGVTAVVDPSEAEPVRRALDERGWGLDWVLNTHHHFDHIGGNETLKETYGARIVAPKINSRQIPGIDVAVADGETLQLGQSTAHVIGIPGHTLGHTAYWFEAAKAVFTGDTLFLMGCGRLFEGTPQQMWESLAKLARLPDVTQVYCGHEYTAKNGEFALTVDTDNVALRERVRALVPGGRTVPGTIGEEKRTNPFLRARDASELGRLRTLKDGFR